MSRTFVFLALSLSGLMAMAGAQNQAKQNQAKQVKIATLSALTGPSAVLGVELRDGAALAVQRRHAELLALGLDVQLEGYDDAGDPTRGSQQAGDMLGDASILGVVGPQASGVCLLAGEVLRRGPIATISPTCTADELTAKGWINFFRLPANTQVQALAMAGYLDDLKVKRAFLVSDNATYGNSLIQNLQRELRGKGVRVVGYAGTSNEVDMQKQVVRSVVLGADAIVFGGAADKTGLFLKQLRQAGSKTPLLGGTLLDSKAFVQAAQGDAAGVTYVTVFGPMSAFANGTPFTSAFQERYGRAPQSRAAFGYDAANTLLEALKAAATARGGVPSRSDLIAALRKVNLEADKNVTGPLSFTATGERLSAPVFIMRIDPTTLTPQLLQVGIRK